MYLEQAILIRRIEELVQEGVNYKTAISRILGKDGKKAQTLRRLWLQHKRAKSGFMPTMHSLSARNLF
jgi:predicted RNA-binding protein YlqC (UPF0109 family)